MSEEQPDTTMVSIACIKGCGVPVNVPMELLKEAAAAGRPFEARHDKCPGEGGEGLRTFRVEIRVAELVGRHPESNDEVWADITKVASSAEDKSFELALKPLTEQLNEVWTTKVVPLSVMVDADPPTLEEELRDEE